jgi:hypothetical protein
MIRLDQAGESHLIFIPPHHPIIIILASIREYQNTTRTDRMSMTQERPLRVLILLASALALPLLIAITVISVEDRSWYNNRDVTAFCFGYIPLAMTAVASTVSIVHQRRYSRMPGPKFALLDGLAGVTYLAILIPIWAVEVGELRESGYGLLTGYTTAPMIVNM